MRGGKIMNDINIIKLIKKLDEVKDSKEDSQYIADLKTIDNMINGTIPIDNYLVESIKKRYESELIFLDNLEKNFRNFQRGKNNSSNLSYDQYLKNLRHALTRVGVMRILKRKGKKMLEDDLINNDNNNLYNKFVNAMDEN